MLFYYSPIGCDFILEDPQEVEVPSSGDIWCLVPQVTPLQSNPKWSFVTFSQVAGLSKQVVYVWQG